MGFGDRHGRSFPELLAAYADGELDEKLRARVEAWLAANPAARLCLETQERFSQRNRRLWRDAAAPSPSEASWARVFGHVQDAIDAPVVPLPAAPQRRWRMRYLAPALSAAAAIAFYLTFSGGVSPPSGPPVAPRDGDVFVLATDADIDILSMDDGDASAIVVGQRPVTGTIVLAAVGDVDLKKIQKAPDGMMPKAQMNDAGMAPMIVAPIAGR